jgi:2-oxoisovalerate dehydrogenase E2 component (dihydrolipoyl transacylase)
MGLYAIKMPDIGEGIAEVEVVEWRVKAGDEVTEDQIVADVMTDKATVEIPSPVAGKVVALGGKPGQLMAVGAELIRLEVAGAGNVSASAAVAAEPAHAQKKPVEPEAPAIEATDEGQAAFAPATPVRAPAVAHPTHEPAGNAPVYRAQGERPLASPAVRRRAWELGVELQFVGGTGPAGRITHADLDGFVARRSQPQQAPADQRFRREEGEEHVPVVGLRRRIAQKMQEAKRRIPHFSYVEEIDVTELEALRAALNARHGASRGKLTLLPLLARAVVIALRDFPQLNARFDDDEGIVHRSRRVHLGIATQTDAGLMVPVIRHAESLDPWACAREIERLAEAARSGKATREELMGSTITISSLGPLGGIVTTPVINHPEVAIIGVNRIVERPTFLDGAVVGRKLMNLSSSFDHRVVDGMDAARFIQAIRASLETPALLFIE